MFVEQREKKKEERFKNERKAALQVQMCDTFSPFWRIDGVKFSAGAAVRNKLKIYNAADTRRVRTKRARRYDELENGTRSAEIE